MFPLAHLGIGSTIATPVSRKQPFRWLLLGTLLPDILDKPVFLALGIHHHFHDGGWIPGKRGFAHTALFLMLLAMIAVRRKSPKWTAVAVGTATHLVLDVISKATGARPWSGDTFAVLFWPFLGWDFPTMSYGIHWIGAVLLEAIGAALLLLQLFTRRGKNGAAA